MFCLHEGAKFYPGEKVVLQECQYTCQCAASEEYSFFMCEPLCTRPYDFMCANGADPVEKMEESSVPGCKCPKYYCPETLSMAHLIEYVLPFKKILSPAIIIALALRNANFVCRNIGL